MQRIPVAIMHERRRTMDLTDRGACGPILPLIENVQLGLRIISGDLTYGDANDALVVRQADTEI